MIKLTGLWKNTDKNGKDCFSGYLGDAKILIFANNYKDKENQPDFIMYLDEKKKKQDGASEKISETFSNDDLMPF